MFASDYDALKNYFCYQYYLLDQSASNLIEFKGMNYPFGDYIFFTDNSPFVAVLSKIFGFKSLWFYNAFFTFNVLVAGYLSYFLAIKLNFNHWVSIFFSLTVSWTNPQILKLASTVNLSMTSFISGILLCIVIHLKQTNNTYKSNFALLGIFTLIFISSFTHLYYLIMNCLMIGFVYLGYWVVTRNHIKTVSGLGVNVLGFGIVFGLFKILDGYYKLRPDEAAGFGYSAWTSTFQDYFTSYSFFSFPSKFTHESWNLERFTYLGSAVIPMLLIAFLIYCLNFKFKYLQHKTNKIVLALLLGGTSMLFISLGLEIEWIKGKYITANYFNPIYLLSERVPKLTHFRCFSRFGMFFFYFVIIWFFYVLNNIDKSKLKPIIKYLIYCIVGFIVLWDLKDMSAFVKTSFYKENVFSSKNMIDVPLFENQTFDAILPLPYYHVGTTDMNYVIDDQDQWSRFTYQLSVKNKLPLMASKMSRTPKEFTKSLFSLFGETPDQELMTKLAGKQILVAYNPNAKCHHTKKEQSKLVCESLDFFLDKYQPELILEKNTLKYYKLQF